MTVGFEDGHAVMERTNVALQEIFHSEAVLVTPNPEVCPVIEQRQVLIVNRTPKTLLKTMKSLMVLFMKRILTM
jgi:hypothetical protein